MNLKELRELSDKELVARVGELKDELFHLRLKKSSGQVEATHHFRLYRKEIARCLTIITARQNEAAQPKAAAASK